MIRALGIAALAALLAGCHAFVPVGIADALAVLGGVSSAESLGHDVFGIDFSIVDKKDGKP